MQPLALLTGRRVQAPRRPESGAKSMQTRFNLLVTLLNLQKSNYPVIKVRDEFINKKVALTVAPSKESLNSVGLSGFASLDVG